ncbi:MAG: hypothetical protein IJ757_03530 [Clostridiales bacterium]|nr:hypothetical protein [Clostridiales bacterium]
MRRINYKFAVIAFIVVTLLQILTFFRIQGNDAYDAYLSGKYYFLAHATTVKEELTNDNALRLASLDYSNPRNLLMVNEWDVYAYGPHGGYCTVVYGEDVITNFPVSRLRFRSELERRIFDDTEKLTREEYDEYVRILADRNDVSAVSDPKMLKESVLSTGRTQFLLIVIIFSVVMAVVLYFVREDTDVFNLCLIIWAGLCILWDVISYYII